MLLPSRSSGSGDHLGRLSRSLIYVGHTPILQFIGGFGVPVQDSSIESVILGYVFRTQYFMPHNASDLPNYELRPQPITGRAASIYRWVLYRGIETLLEKVGLPGRSCLSALCSSSNDHLKRLSRSLIYPETAPTRLQFIGGIGIPVEDLHFESITSGYVLKAEYFLPINASELTHHYLRPQAITGREEDVSSSDSPFNYASIYRWMLYRGVETLLEKAGLPGQSCLLRVICEHAALPLSHESGLLAEILHIILTPSSSQDALAKHTDRDYLMAERFGRRGGDCRAAFAKKCKKSPMDFITMLIEVNG
ncbi:uncharacterized protein LOC115623866 [Scaptodrosophila lebanonensis]|uniref:Uncharacterized protein LOC115623866 n=1 Tax=Drosophila lebanonensis TaxID=7225 RepID=A0A6J2TGX1_DROLE|nr:uncharacterized protein LOC115623866 [Scaptodrosophila lebanonensis]